MLGGGNPVGGSNPAGIGNSLNYIGDFAYGYSGSINASNSSSADTTLLDFTSGSESIVGTIAFQTTEVASNVIYFDLIMNGSSIISAAWDNSGSGQASANTPIDLIIPPFTHIQVKWGITGGTGANATAEIVGRVY